MKLLEPNEDMTQDEVYEELMADIWKGIATGKLGDVVRGYAHSLWRAYHPVPKAVQKHHLKDVIGQEVARAEAYVKKYKNKFK